MKNYVLATPKSLFNSFERHSVCEIFKNIKSKMKLIVSNIWAEFDNYSFESKLTLAKRGAKRGWDGGYTPLTEVERGGDTKFTLLTEVEDGSLLQS
mmetsp:Transcript_31020/g.40972  ORF Transcript_31020/g.40972 Transcript_31020/m.40972 type:complete len:96 (-) Transcript_31020:132-419(-)